MPESPGDTQLIENLETWLQQRGGLEDPRVLALESPASGVVNETYLCSLTHSENGKSVADTVVLRLQPATRNTPIPDVDVEEQAFVLERLANYPELKTPGIYRYEPESRWLGRPFYIMQCMPGEAVFDAQTEPREPECLRLMYEQAIAMLARIHAVDWERAGLQAICRGSAGCSPLRAQFAAYRSHLDNAAGGRTYPLLEDAFIWLQENFPAETEPVLNWGDARIGNLLFDGTELTAVLDWEIAEITCREVDIGWFVFFERFLWNNHNGDRPGAMSGDEIVSLYEHHAGVKVADLAWFQRWAAFRLAIMRLRAGRFAIDAGEEPASSRIDEVNFASVELARLFGYAEPE